MKIFEDTFDFSSWKEAQNFFLEKKQILAEVELAIS